MTRLAIVFTGWFLYILQSQILPALFHKMWLPDAILTAIIVLTLFKGRTWGLSAAVVGGLVQDILISNFFGLHLFPYIIVVYMVSFITHRIYEERWYWTCLFVLVFTVFDGILRSMMIYAGGGDIHFAAYMWYLVMPTLFWNALMGAIYHLCLQRNQHREDYIW